MWAFKEEQLLKWQSSHRLDLTNNVFSKAIKQNITQNCDEMSGAIVLWECVSERIITCCLPLRWCHFSERNQWWMAFPLYSNWIESEVYLMVFEHKWKQCIFPVNATDNIIYRLWKKIASKSENCVSLFSFYLWVNSKISMKVNAAWKSYTSHFI